MAPTSGAGERASPAMTSGAESTVRNTSPPIDRRQGEIGADREVDAARQDDQVLADRDDGDDSGLRENVADVDGFRK